MSVDKAIWTILSTEISATRVPTPSDQISNRPIAADVPYPHLPFRIMDDPERFGRPEHWARLRVWVKAGDFFVCRQIAEAVHDALNGGNGTVASADFTFDYIQCLDRGYDPDLNPESGKFETYLDFRLCYR